MLCPLSLLDTHLPLQVAAAHQLGRRPPSGGRRGPRTSQQQLEAVVGRAVSPAAAAAVADAAFEFVSNSRAQQADERRGPKGSSYLKSRLACCCTCGSNTCSGHCITLSAWPALSDERTCCRFQQMLHLMLYHNKPLSSVLRGQMECGVLGGSSVPAGPSRLLLQLQKGPQLQIQARDSSGDAPRTTPFLDQCVPLFFGLPTNFSCFIG